MKLMCLFLVIAAASADVSHLKSADGPDKEAQILKQSSDITPEDNYQWAYETSNQIAAQEQGAVKQVGPGQNPSRIDHFWTNANSNELENIRAMVWTSDFPDHRTRLCMQTLVKNNIKGPLKEKPVQTLTKINLKRLKRGLEGEEAAITVQGSAQWVDPSGVPISFTYVADENGYQPQGHHIPGPPPMPEAVA